MRIYNLNAYIEVKSEDDYENLLVSYSAISRCAKLHSNIKSFYINELLHSAKRKLLNVRIKLIYRKNLNLYQIKGNCLTEFRDRLTFDVYNEVSQFIVTPQLAQHVSMHFSSDVSTSRRSTSLSNTI